MSTDAAREEASRIVEAVPLPSDRGPILRLHVGPTVDLRRDIAPNECVRAWPPYGWTVHPLRRGDTRG